MSIVVEDGTGKVDANSYSSVADAVAYLETYGSVPAAFADKAATGTLRVAEQPINNDEFTLNNEKFVMKTSLAPQGSDTTVAIGSDLAETKANIIAAINKDGVQGSQYIVTAIFPDTPTAASSFDDADLLEVTAREGGVAGNSLNTTSNFDAVINGFVHRSSTLSGGEATRERLLIEATRWLDLEWNRRVLGYRTYDSQALVWPLTGAYRRDGRLVDENVVPSEIPAATAIVAASGQELAAVVDDPSEVRRERVKAGSIEEEIEYVGSRHSGTARFPLVEGLLGAFELASDRIGRA